jgi:ribosomal subunit interface protein
VLVTICGRGVVLTPPFKALVEGKVAKLDRVLPRIVEARVILEAEKFRRTVRLIVRASPGSFSSQATARNLRVAVDIAVETLRRQIRDDKTRRRPLKGRRPAELAAGKPLG